MELRHLRYFIVIAETGSLSGAAENLHIAQPALTQNIKSLEAELNTTLFERSRKGMTLTDTGVQFLTQAQNILRQVSNAKQSILEAEDDPVGSVSIVAPASVSHILTVPLFQSLQKKYPRIELIIREGLTGDLERRFALELDDIFIDFDTEESAEHVVESMLREELFFIEQYQPGLPDTIPFIELAEYPLFLPRQKTDAMSKTIDRYAQIENVELPTVQGASSMHSMLRLVQAGLGHSILPWSAIFDLVGKTVHARKIIAPELFRKVCVVTKVSGAKGPATIKVLETIRESVRELHQKGQWKGELLL